VGAVKDKLAGAAHAVADSVTGTASSTKGKASGTASSAKDAVSGAASSAQEAVGGAAASAQEAVAGELRLTHAALLLLGTGHGICLLILCRCRVQQLSANPSLLGSDEGHCCVAAWSLQAQVRRHPTRQHRR
jgi:hypothetical protein